MNVFKTLWDRLTTQVFVSNAGLDEGFTSLWRRMVKGNPAWIHEDSVVEIKISELKRLLKIAYHQRHTDAKKICDTMQEQIAGNALTEMQAELERMKKGMIP